MSNVVTLDSLLNQAQVWRGTEAGQSLPAGVPSGFAALDEVLPGGGWPQGALTEIISDHQGAGELSMLMPTLARLSREGRWLAWIAPPHIPYAPALSAYGVDLSKVLVVRPRGETDTLWALEQALRSGTCGAVLAWPRIADERSLRRLQLAAEAGNTLGVLFRSGWAATQSSPAALRVRIEPVPGGSVDLRVLKRRGGWPTGPIRLTMESYALAESFSAEPAPGSLLAGDGR